MKYKHYTFELCKETALKYNTRKDFREKHNNMYGAAHRKGWLSEITSHMNIIGNKFYRLIYAFEFEDNSVYVGLTSNSNRRKNEHYTNKNSQVYKHLNIINIKPVYKELTNYIDTINACKLEEAFILEYKNKGWNILNKAKSGGLGSSNIEWTYEACKKVALKYTTRTELQENESGLYGSALKNKWLNEICSHMIEIRKPKNFWTYETCKEVASKCKSKTEFIKKSSRAYTFSRENKWLNEFFPKKKN